MVEQSSIQQNTKTILPGARKGSVTVPSSKSQLHRLLICAALGESTVQIAYRGLSEDIEATVRCLNALGTKIETAERDGQSVLLVQPLDRAKQIRGAVLDCGESGSTLRFLLPIAGLLGAECTFLMWGRLSKRPLTYYDEQLRLHGMTLQQEGDVLRVCGRLGAGKYVLPGNISSQYISGLLMAFGGLAGSSSLAITGTPESTPYIDMTERVLQQSGIAFCRENLSWSVEGGQAYRLPEVLQAEGDYSSATFFLCMGALSSAGILVRGLDPLSAQGDRAVLQVLRSFGADVEETAEGICVKKDRLKGTVIDASQIPDSVPALSVLGALAEGQTEIVNARRLRLKESDRIRSTAAMLRALGGQVEEREDGMTIFGSRHLSGGTVDPFGDHRIAMAAAEAACGCSGPVTICGPGCAAKSYPQFWTDLEQLSLEKQSVPPLRSGTGESK